MTQDEFIKELDKLKKDLFPKPRAEALSKLGSLIREYYETKEESDKDKNSYSQLVDIINRQTNEKIILKNKNNDLINEIKEHDLIIDSKNKQLSEYKSSIVELNKSIEFYVTQSKQLQDDLKDYNELKRTHEAFISIMQQERLSKKFVPSESKEAVLVHSVEEDTGYVKIKVVYEKQGSIYIKSKKNSNTRITTIDCSNMTRNREEAKKYILSLFGLND